MSILGKIGKVAARVGAATVTGGGSEVYRAVTGKPDPITGIVERKIDTIDNSVGGPGGASPYVSETPEERLRRQRQEADLQTARAYRDQLASQTPVATAAPAIGAPAPVQGARVGATEPIGAPVQVAAERVGSTFSTAGQRGNADAQTAYMDRLRAVEAGTAGPSAAELQMRRGSAAAVSQAYALAAGHKGYSTAALRNAQRVGAGLQQQNVTETGILRASEIANARQQYGQAVTAARGQDIGLSQAEAELALRAAQSNQQTGLSAAQTNQGAGVDIAKANMAAQLQTNLTKAGFDQQAIMHMSDQQLQVALANAGFQLSQQQINELRANNQRQTVIAAQGQVLGAGEAQGSRDAQIRQLKAQYAMAVQQNDQRKQDALLGTLAQLGAGYATGGA